MGLRVFISYSHRDEELKDRLLAHLSPLTRDGTLTTWDDRQIRPGEDWRQGIETALAQCDLALLLVSADFLNSDFCVDAEGPVLLGRREQEGVRVVPVILRDCLWQRVSWLGALQAVPRDGRPVASTPAPHDEAFTQVVAALDKLLRQPATPAQPQPVAAPAARPKVSVARLPATGRELFGRDAELGRLDAAWEDPDTHIATIIGFGGMGKSALTNHWLARMRRDGYRGAQRVYAWSFYSQGTRDEVGSADQFISDALLFFGDPDPAQGSPWGKGERLARLVRKQPTLLILDGVEPLQFATSADYGGIGDPGLDFLLRELAGGMDGLCLVSSRVELTDLAGFDAVQQVSLDRLSTEAGRALLEAAGVQAPGEEMGAAVVEYDGHALALVLLAEYLREFCNGDIGGRGDVPLLDEEMPEGRHAFRVMEAYDAALKREGREVERAILRVLGLFDRPATKGCLDAVRREPKLTGVTNALAGLPDAQWQHAVANLRRLRLVLEPSDGEGSLDAHPLVREHFGRKAEQESPTGFREAHGRLYEYLRDTTKEWPDTLAEMAPLFQAVYHGCRAGRHQDALDEVYWRRMQRKGSFCISALGATGEVLAASAGFFRRPWSQPITGLTPRGASYMLNEGALCLQSLGRLGDALQAFQAGLAIDEAGDDWVNASTAAQNMADAALASGDLAAADIAAGRALGLSEKAADAQSRLRSEAYVGYVLRCQGSLAAARPHFEEAERLQREVEPGAPYLYSGRGWLYCELLLDLGRAGAARERAAHALTIARRNRDLLGIACDELTLGRSDRCLADQNVTDTAAVEAGQHLDAAVQTLRGSGWRDELPSALLARASFRRDFGDRDQADRDLKEALTLSTRIGLRLHEADARLLEGHMALDETPPDVRTAEAALSRATALVDETGYHLRDADLLIIEGRLVALRDDRAAGRRLLGQAITVARREEAEDAVYQAAVDEAERYLRELG